MSEKPRIDITHLKDHEKANWFSELMYYESKIIIFEMMDGFQTLDEFGTLKRKRDCYIRPRSPPSTEIKHTDISKAIVNVVKKNKCYLQEDENTITLLQPTIQSGGIYNLDIDCDSDENYFRDDVIILCFKAKCKEYLSTIIRTIVITPDNNKKIKKNYKFLLRVQKFIIVNLRDGAELSQVHHNTCEFVRNTRPDLLENLTDNFGSVIGMHSKDDNCVIHANSKGIARENTRFFVNVGLVSIFDAKIIDRAPHTYSLWIGDCVTVQKGKRATLSKRTFYEDKKVVLRQPRPISQMYKTKNL